MRWIHVVFALALAVAAPLHSADPPGTATSPPVASPTAEAAAASEATREYIRQFKGRGAVGDFSSKPLPPADALKAFQVPSDLRIELVASEPQVEQPLHLSFDERGRMWVVQYRQYPFPAGLKIVKYDEHLRALFDKMPDPPPHGERGADRITVHTDTDGDGRYDATKVVVEGLNIATAAAVGRGGLWVMNPPYLLFYPDRNGDDLPDGDPEVHLRGFGLEDTHAVANSLAWGPDGWLYGCQGSTVWATVDSAVTKGVHFKGQAIWRYHPETKVFEMFAEGGGNAFGLEFDAAGRCYSGHNGGDTRGFHYVQGGYYQKSWGKHGALTNPYAFGFFPQMKHARVERFSHTFLKYEADALPRRYWGLLFAPVPLHQHIALSEIRPDGSTFQTRDLEKVVTTADTWFRPVDIKTGPDGAVYIADWYDTRLTHVDPRDTWHKGSGRIYRLVAADATPAPRFDLSRATPQQLVAELASPNKTRRQIALRLLGDRRPSEVLPRLRELLGENGPIALEALWASYQIGGLDNELALTALRHANPHVRAWGVRLVGDTNQASGQVVEALLQLARGERDLEVKSQLACSARRLPATAALPIVGELAKQNDAGDPHLPLLLWWAVEKHAIADRGTVMARFGTSAAWEQPLVAEAILPRLAQRYAAEATPENLDALSELILAAPAGKARESLLAAMNTAFQGRRVGRLPKRLVAALATTSQEDPASAAALHLRLRAGDAAAELTALKQIARSDLTEKERLQLIELLGEVGTSAAQPALRELAFRGPSSALRSAALAALQHYDEESLGDEFVARFGELASDEAVRAAAIDVLASRKVWALELLAAIAAGRIDRTYVSLPIVERLKLHGDPAIDKLVAKLWGQTRASPKELAAQIEQVAGVLAAGPGDPAQGKAIFTQKCGACHKLFGEGKEIGPDLTGYERSNVEFLLLSVIDPNAFVREEFTTFRVTTTDGRILTGFIQSQSDQAVTLVSADKGPLTIARADIEEGPVALRTSLMPERLVADLASQQLRDLFAYLRLKK